MVQINSIKNIKLSFETIGEISIEYNNIIPIRTSYYSFFNSTDGLSWSVIFNKNISSPIGGQGKKLTRQEFYKICKKYYSIAAAGLWLNNDETA